MQSEDFAVIILIVLWTLMFTLMGAGIHAAFYENGPQIIVRYTFNDSDCAQTNMANIYLCEVKNEKPVELEE